MCDFHSAGSPCGRLDEVASAENARRVSRRQILGAAGVSAATLAAGSLIGRTPSALAAPRPPAGMSVTLLGTNGGPPPLAARFGISSALAVNGRIYVIDCGRGAVSQYVRAGLALSSLAGIFLTHLHSDHTVDYFSFPLLSATTPPAFQSVAIYGPGPAGVESLLRGAPGPVPGTAAMTSLANQAFAASSSFFITEHIGIDPATLLNVHEVMPPASAGASLGNPAPTGMAPFMVSRLAELRPTAEAGG